MKTTKILSAMLTGAMLIGASSFTVSAEANSVPEAVDGVVTLTEDVTVSTYTINQDLVLNLNGCTLDAAVRIDNGAENVTIKNGNLVSGGSYAIQLYNSNADLTIDTVKISGKTQEDINGVGGVYINNCGGNLTIVNSEIRTGDVKLVDSAKVYSNRPTVQSALNLRYMSGDVEIIDSKFYGGNILYDGTITEYNDETMKYFNAGVDSTIDFVNTGKLTVTGSEIYGGNNDVKDVAEAALKLQGNGAEVSISDTTIVGGDAGRKNEVASYGIGGAALEITGNNTKTSIEIADSTLKGGNGKHSWGGCGIEIGRCIPVKVAVSDSKIAGGSKSSNGYGAAIYYTGSLSSGVLDTVELNNVELSAAEEGVSYGAVKGDIVAKVSGDIKITGKVDDDFMTVGEANVTIRQTPEDEYKPADTATEVKAYHSYYGGGYYKSLADAANDTAMPNGTVLTLLADVTLDDYLIFNKNITLDLDGHTLTSNYVMGTTRGENYAIRFTAGGTITDSAAEKGELVATKARAVNAAGGVLTLKDATVRVTDDGVSSGNAVIGTNNGLVMTNSKVYGDFTGSYAVCSFGKVEEKIRISDSVIFGTHMGFYRNGSAGHLDMTVKNSEITSNDYAVYISNHKGNLKNGEIYFHDVSFTDTTVKGQLGIEVKYTNLTLEDCDVTATGTPSFVQNNNGPEANGFAVVVTDNSVNDEKAEPMGTITIKSGNYQGLIGLENLPEAKAYMADDVKNDVRISGGTFSTDVSAYTAPGFAAKKVGDKWIVDDSAVALTLGFKETTDARVYDIVVTAADETKINRLNTADLTFALTATSADDSTVTYEILPVTGITVTSDNANANRYMFNFNGKDAGVIDTGKEIKIGQVRFEGYTKNGAKITFSTDIANSLVTATSTDGENVVTYFGSEAGLTADTVNKIENVKFAVPTNKLTVNITFPNAIADQGADYQDMKVVISGSDLAKNLVYKLGTGEDATALEGGAYKLVVDGKLTENTAYTVTVSGAGYRTARYTVTMTADKTLNFWNNVKDTPAVVEEGKDASKKSVTFLAGDIVKDGKINIYDLSAVVSYFGTNNTVSAESAYAKYDLNRDGKIDSKDVAYVLVSWGK